MRTVHAGNEEGTAYAILQATGPQLPKAQDLEAQRPIRTEASRRMLEAEEPSREFHRTLRALAKEQAEGRNLEEGNLLLLGVLTHGRPCDREAVLQVIRRTVGKQLRRSLGGARSQSSARTTSRKAYAEAEGELASALAAWELSEEEEARLRSEARTLANDRTASRARTSYTALGRRLSDPLQDVDLRDATEEAVGEVLIWLFKSEEDLREEHLGECRTCREAEGPSVTCRGPVLPFTLDRSFLSQVKARAHNGLRRYLRRVRHDLKGLSEDHTFGEVLQDAVGESYRFGVDSYRTEASRLVEVLAVAEEVCRSAHLSDSRTSRILSLAKAGFEGREEDLPYPATDSGRVLLHRDRQFLQKAAAVFPDLREVLFATG